MTNTLEILESTGGLEGSFVTKYIFTNGNMNISKSASVIPFGIPLVSETNYPTTAMITEKCDLVAISGISASITIDWWLGLADLKTVLDLVNKAASVTHCLRVNEWTTNAPIIPIDFYGRVSDISANMEAGTPMNLKANLTFMVGAIVDFGDGV